MPVGIFFSELRTSSGDSLIFEPRQLVIVVGPNNSGKSSCLLELYRAAYLSDGSRSKNHGPVLACAAPKALGTTEEALAWFDTNHPANDGYYRVIDKDLNRKQVQEAWTNPTNASWFAPFFVSRSPTESRLSTCNSTAASPNSRTFSNPLHYVFESRTTELELSSAFESAFGIELVLNRIGASVSLHCGQRKEVLDGLSSDDDTAKRDRILALPALEKQGDGMRAFGGVLLDLLCTQPTVHLIDEPELFLHPPQARIMGNVIGRHSERRDCQILVATHSGDLLRGVLETQSECLKIIRLSRVGNTTRANELSATELRTFWSDPSLRFSNTLDGLFHEAVVICEDDADCRFYSAIVEALVKNSTEKRPDIMYTACGGKHKIAKIVPALIRVGVPTWVIVDFDVLDEQSTIKHIVEGLGHDWADMQRDWNVVHAAIEQRSTLLNKNQVAQGIREVLDDLSTQTVTEDATKQIRDILKQVSPWKIVKESGLTAIPAGDAYEAASRLLQSLKKAGVFVVPCGEMESFAKGIGGHGAKWVLRALERDIASDPDLGTARSFSLELLDHIVSALDAEAE